MATTRTPGITVLTDGRRFIDKRYLGIRIGLRVGAVTQEQAEERLHIEIARVQCDLARKAHARPTFTDCAGRYVAQSRDSGALTSSSGTSHCSIRTSEISNRSKFTTRRWNPSLRRGLPVARVRPRSIAVWKSCARS